MRLYDGVRLGHVNLEVSNLGAARSFYDKILPVLGFTRVPGADRFWLGYRKGRFSMWITVSRPRRVDRRAPHVPTDGVRDPISDHLGFRAPSLKRVYALERALAKHGLEPVYSTSRQSAHGATWYTSNAWKDADNNVIEVYAVTRR